ncbi:hypothetical protein [Rhodococcus erythropolis]|uniref:hypothetical protein n=1 Tax=Rhodococcus erythropolis TaxID=1833 RepID=UPI00366ABEEC
MSVTADQIEAVAEHAEAVHLVGAAQQLRGRAAHVRLVESQPVEVVELAAAIRDAYYNDGVRRELLSSRDPGQWLRMAVEAKSALGESDSDLAAMAPGLPRVFNVGDREPEDRDTITLRGVANGTDFRPAGTELIFKFGDHGSDDSDWGFGRQKWWQVTEPKHTYGTWDSRLEHYGPLTEVLDEPKSQPRTFEWGDDEPDNITHARDDEGDLFKRILPNRWAMKLGSGDFGESIYTWNEVVVNGATEAFGDLG